MKISFIHLHVLILFCCFLNRAVGQVDSFQVAGATSGKSGAGIDLSYPANAENLVLCEGPGKLTMQVQVIAPLGVNSPVVITVILPAGINYVPGSVTSVFSNPADITISEFDITDPEQPVFHIERPGGFSIGNTIQLTIDRIAVDCMYYGPSGITQGGLALKDIVSATTNLGTLTEDDIFTNTYQVRSGVLSISPISSLAIGLDSTYERPIIILNGGLDCISGFEVVITATNNVNHEGLTFNEVSLTLVSQSGLVYTYALDTSQLGGDGICPGDQIELVESVTLNNCFSGSSNFNYSVRWGCEGNICQTFNRTGSYLADIGLSLASYTDELVEAGTFCTPAVVRRTFTNTSSSPSQGLRDFLDIAVSMSLSASAPVTFFDFGIVDGAAVIPVTVAQTTSGGNNVYTLNFTNQNISVLADSDGDGFMDDLPLGSSITIEYKVQRSCIGSGCTATFPRSCLSSSFSYLPKCNFLANSTARVNLAVTGPPVCWASDMIVNASHATTVITDDEVGNITIGHNRRFENSYFEPCQAGSVTLTFELASNLILSGNVATVNGTNVTMAQVGNIVTVNGSYSLNASNVLEALFVIPIAQDNCDMPGGDFFPGSATSYTITNTCHENCCTETWACGNISPVNGICINGNCSPSFIHVDSISFTRSNFGYTDAYGQIPVNPAVLSPQSVRTVIHGDTLLVYSNTSIFSTNRDTVTFVNTFDKINGVNPVMALDGLARFVYTPAVGSPVSADIPLSAINVNNQSTYTSYSVLVDAAFNSGTVFPPGFEFEAGSSVEFFLYFKVADIPTHPILFPLGVNSLLGWWNICTSSILPGEDNHCCGANLSFRYYNYDIEIRNYVTPDGSICDTSYTNIGTRVYINGTRSNVFPNEVRPLIYFDDVNFAISGLTWQDDRVGIIRRGQDPSTAPVNYTATSTNGYVDNQNFVPVAGIWPVTDDLGAVTNSPAPNGTEVYSFNKRYFSTCEDEGLFSVAHGFDYREWADDTVKTYSFSNNGTILPDSDMPIYVNTNSNIDMSGVSPVQTWALRYDAPAASNRRFGGHLVLAVDNSGSDGIEILDIYEVNSAGVRINQAITTLFNWSGGLWAGIAGGLNAGTRHFRVDYRFTSCEPDTAVFYLGKACNGFPASPLDVTCGLDSRNLIVRPESSELQFYITSQPTTLVSLCEPLNFSFIYNSSLQGNVINPEIWVKYSPGIDLGALSVQGKYPNVPAGSFETLPYSVNGEYIVISLNSLANINPLIGLPGLVLQPANPASRQILLNLSITTDCNFISGSSFELAAFGDMACGVPAFGDSTIIRTNTIKSLGASDYNYFLQPLSIPDINGCGNTVPVDFNLVVLGTESTAPGDIIYIRLPNGLTWNPGSYTCSNDPSGCPVFVGDSIAPSGDQYIIFTFPSSFPQGSVVNFAFEVNIDPAIIECGAASAAITIISTILNVPCQTGPGGVCTEVDDIKLDAEIPIEISLPDIVFDGFSYDVTANGLAVTGNVINNGGALLASDILTLNIYCLDEDGLPQGAPVADHTISGPLDQGDSLAVEILINSACAFQYGIGIKMEKDPGALNCVCDSVVILLDIETQIVCPGISDAACTNTVEPPYTSVSEFAAAGGLISGFCEPGDLLQIELVLEVSDSMDCNRLVTRIYRIFDSCDNEMTCEQTFYILSAGMPSFNEDLPQDTLVDCDAVPEAVVLTATGSCGHGGGQGGGGQGGGGHGGHFANENSRDLLEVIYTEVRTDGHCPYNYTLTRTWTAIDDCDNEISHTQVVTVQDTTAPVFIEALPLDTIVNCDAVPAADILTATDNCGTAPVVYNETRTDGDCPYSYVLTRTWTATDDCDNASTYVQVVTVQDTTIPVFVETLPLDTIVNCDAVPVGVVLTATDNCGMATVEFAEMRTGGDCPSNYVLARIWTATDECGNISTHVQVVTVQDTVAPVFVETLPLDTIVDCDAVPVGDILTATDNCGVTMVEFTEARTNGDCPYNYVLARTWTATDECENVNTHLQVVTVQDTTRPDIVINDPFFAGVEDGSIIRVQCRAMEEEWELPVLDNTEITVTDNCGMPTFTMTQEVSEGSCRGDGYFKRISYIIVATDECHNETSMSFVMEVVDTIPPVFTIAPPDATVSCMDTSWMFEIKATDECECANISFEDRRTDGRCPGEYTIERRYTATDCCGNMSFHTQLIHVIDTVSPVLVPVIAELAAINNGDTLSTYCDGEEIPVWLALPAEKLMKAIDGCSGPVDVKMNIEKTNAGACWLYKYISLYKIEFSAADQCGNASEFVFYIRVLDTVAPKISYMKEMLCAGDKSWPVAEDNCSGIQYSYEDSPVNGLCNDGTNYIRTWSLSDDCGNTTYATQYIIANDGKAPEMSLLAGPYKGMNSGDIITLKCSDGIEENAEVIRSWMTASDDCDIFNLVFQSSESRGDCAKAGYVKQVEWKWTATDNCGNSSEFVLYIRLTDDEKPYFTNNLKEITVDCLNNLPPVRAYDDCSEVTLVSGSIRTDGDCPGNFTLNERYVATDACGNSTEFERVVHVTDHTGPVIDIPEAVCAGQEIDIPAYALDYCNNEKVKLGSKKGQKKIPCGKGYYYEITYSATDACGNTSNKVQRVISGDREGPVLSFTDDFRKQYYFENDHTIHVSCEAYDSLVSLIGRNAAVSVTDVCSGVADLHFAQHDKGAYCDSKKIYKEYIFNWTAADACGNEGTLELLVKMTTDKAPDFSFVPGDTTVYCESKVELPLFPALTCGFVSLTGDITNTPPDGGGNYTEIRTWTYVNECGESDSRSQSILHSLHSDLDCNIIGPSEVHCNSSENEFTVIVNGGNGPYSYYWEVMNGSCHILSGQHTPVVIISVSFKTLYLKVTVTDANGCKSTCYISVDCIIDGIEGQPAEPDPEAAEDISIKPYYQLYPNPTNAHAYITIDSDKKETVVLMVSDQLGKVMMERKMEIIKGRNKILLDTDILSPGIYNVMIRGNGSNEALNMVKVR